ncbi:MAG: beta-ketoacyl synthase N-terminal-like domain-containing protein [bacterium]|nr:beta-ketoacyl synthase N-terminal-like domain-containing protein [bacterium]
MNTDIYITGTGQTPFGEHWDMGLRELMDSAIDSAIKDAGISVLDIDLVIVANMLAERTSDQAHLGAMASSLLPHQPPALRVESACASGAMALHTACGMLESGKVETVLVVGVEKMTDADTGAIASGLMGAADSELDSPSGITFPGIFGLIANRYMYEHSLSRERLSAVSAKHHSNAMANPFAQFRMEVSPEAVTSSTTVAEPLCMLDCSPISDGAAACILSTKHQSSLKIAASQIASDTVSITQRESITGFKATKQAAAKAFAEAAIHRNDIAHLEIHDCFSIAAIINLEDLGYAAPGTGVKLYENPGKQTINASGGLKACGHPVAATGVKQIIDIGKQLKASGKRYGLAHNFGGACATCGIHILEHTAV